MKYELGQVYRFIPRKKNATAADCMVKTGTCIQIRKRYIVFRMHGKLADYNESISRWDSDYNIHRVGDDGK